MSTNAIERIGSLAGLKNLKILSLGRNNIKKLEKMEDVAATLEQLWISHNSIEKLDGLSSCKQLRVLYMSNNCIKQFDELLKLVSSLRKLVDCTATARCSTRRARRAVLHRRECWGVCVCLCPLLLRALYFGVFSCGMCTAWCGVSSYVMVYCSWFLKWEVVGGGCSGPLQLCSHW